MTSWFSRAALAAGVALGAPVALQAQAADPAAARMASYDDAVVGVMKARLDLARRADRFEAIVGAYYDMPAIAALVVGPTWPQATPAARTAAIGALTRHSAVSLARNFTKYDGERFTVTPNVATRGASRIVQVTIASSGGSPGATSSRLLYQLRQSGGEWRIVDVIADGVSQLAVQRADLAGTIAAGGLPALARRLAEVDARAASHR